jgi:hypothetical protein
LPVERVVEKAVRAPEQESRFEARRTVEALRYGIVPNKRIRELSVGLDRECKSLGRGFEEVERTGGDVRAVVGEYGTGKTHFFEVAAAEALDRNYLVAKISLDLREVPPNRPQRIYNAIIRALRYPDSLDTGTLVPIFDRIVGNSTVYASLIEKLTGTIFGGAIYNYSLMRQNPGKSLDMLLDWISGEKVQIKIVRDSVMAKNKEFPVKALSMTTTSADQYCYLLNGWGWLATQVGYKGLAIFIDESEHYSLLTQHGKERADNFFKAMIYATTAGHRGCRVRESDLQHQRHEYPFRFTDESRLFYMFALTPSTGSFDYKKWLSSDQIIVLDGNLPEAALDELMARIYVLHRKAYNYQQGDYFLDISHALLECLERKLINLRQTIRLAVEIYDLCYSYPDFGPARAIEELHQKLLAGLR